MKLPDKIIKLMKVFSSNGFEIFVVGGAVRDLLLKREVGDWDMTTNATPDEMKKMFPKNSFYNNEYGTFSVVNSDGEVFEITTYRTENEYDDNRHPKEIKWGKTLEEDVQRRDFTINALAIDINGKVYDYWNGQEDLKNGIIRTVGKPDERFKEDGLRMLRAIRISAQIGFLIDEATFEAIIENSELIKKISWERIRDEIFKILVSKNPVEGFRFLKNSGLLQHIIPELLAGVDMKQKGHHVYDVWNHSLEALRNCGSNDPVTKLATLLHDIAKPVVVREENGERTFHNHEVVGSRMAVEIGKRLRLSKLQQDKLFKLVRWHMFTTEDVQTDKAVRRFIRNVTPDYLDDMILLRRSDRLGSGAKETSWRWELFKKRLVEVQKQPFTVKDLKVNGNDVMEILKIKPGRKIGEVLDKLFAMVEEDVSLNEREILMQKIKELGY